ncbi:MAG: hypothetical protein HY801_09840 [Candidatus Lindowbacteria bacterium]|nr:hypothetical protein [Candidatus Lindowbacteria bacterium]
MTDKAGLFRKTRRRQREGFLAFPRLLAMLAICGLATSPFVPWLESEAKGGPITFKELAAELVGAGALPVNAWFLPLILAVLFMLPLLTDLQLTRAFYYVLLIEVLVAAGVLLYPSTRGLLLKTGVPLSLPSLRYGAQVFIGALLLVLVSAVITLWQSRLGVAILVATLIITAAIVIGSVTAWFGYLTGEPRIWHQGYDARVPEGQALGVHLTISNEGWGKFKVNLNAPEKPQETDLIVSAQRYYRVGNYWADFPLAKFMIADSKSTLPKEVEPGDAIVLDMVIGPLTSASALYSLPPRGASGKYSVWLNDFSGKRSYHYEFEVPPEKTLE